MTGIQITPSGVGQTLMIICAFAGVALIIDSIMYMNDIKTLLNYIGLEVYLDERVRAVVLILIGLLAFMFGLGLWTIAVGAIAIATIVAMTYGNIWGATAWEGTRPNTSTVQTQQAQAQNTNNGATRYRCPMEKANRDWCLEDHDNNGILNRDQRDPNGNCDSKSFVSDTKISNACKVIQ